MNNVIIASIVYGCFIGVLSYCYTLTRKRTKITNYTLSSLYIFAYPLSYYSYKIIQNNPYQNILIISLIIGFINIILYKLLNYLNNKTDADFLLSYILFSITLLIVITTKYTSTWLRNQLEFYSGFLIKEADFRFLGVPGVFISSLLLTALLLSVDRVLIQRKTDLNPSLIWFYTGVLSSLVGGLAPFWFQSTPSVYSLFSLFCAMLAGSIFFHEFLPSFSFIGGFMAGFLEIVIVVLAQEVGDVSYGEFRFLIPFVFLLIASFRYLQVHNT
jgi:hypothetical protein